MKKIRTIATGITIAACCAASPAFAQRGASPPPPEWDISLGVAGVISPTFEGSDHYRARPFPLVTIKWRDTIAFDQNGLTAQWKGSRLRLGGGLTFDSGRDDHGSGGLFESGDNRLAGLGKIDFALGLKGFAAYRLGPVEVNASVTKFTGKQNEGVQATIGASAPLPLGKKLMLVPNLRATWADTAYTQTYFGVTPIQAARSRFAAYSAGGGLQDISAGVNLVYSFNRHWFAGGNARVTRLMGKAAESPISISDTSATLVTMVGYRF